MHNSYSYCCTCCEKHLSYKAKKASSGPKSHPRTLTARSPSVVCLLFSSSSGRISDLRTSKASCSGVLASSSTLGSSSAEADSSSTAASSSVAASSRSTPSVPVSSACPSWTVSCTCWGGTSSTAAEPAASSAAWMPIAAASCVAASLSACSWAATAAAAASTTAVSASFTACFSASCASVIFVKSVLRVSISERRVSREATRPSSSVLRCFTPSLNFAPR
mmetsp:Transcript_16738/g.24597  ORF Transcript_16738/g.24597 Transcript_16738/m.24597 type:complete len:221 (-) Transcript_16738:462-1124(-)